jgi:hypothetical protein
MSFSTQRFLTTTSIGLEEVPSSTKVTYKKGKKLLFPTHPPTVGIKGKRSFTRSSIPKEV